MARIIFNPSTGNIESADNVTSPLKTLGEKLKLTGGNPLPEDPTKPINPWAPKPIGPVLPNKMMAADGGVIRQHFGDGTPTKLKIGADKGLYSVRLRDFTKPIVDGIKPKKTHIGTLEELKKIVKQNKLDAKESRRISGVKTSEVKATWLKDYSMEDYVADLKNGKTRVEIGRELYAKNPSYYNDLNKLKFDLNNPTALSRITLALRGRTLVRKGETGSHLKRYKKLNKLALSNEVKYKNAQKAAHKAAKEWIKTNGPKYKKMIVPGEVTGAQSKFEKAFYKYMTDNFPRFIRHTTGTSGAATLKGLPYIDEISRFFGKKGSNQALHVSSLRTELQKALGTFKEKGISPSKSFNRYINTVEKLLPTAQKNGVVDKYWTPKGGKFSGQTIPVTAQNYLAYLDQKVKNPMLKVFNNLVKFSNEHVGGIARANKILDSDALGKVVAMEFGDKTNVNLYKGKTIDSNIGDALQAAMDEDPTNVKKWKGHIANANKFSDTAAKKYGVLQTKYSAEVEDGKIKIKAKHPDISLQDSLVSKTKNAIHSFIANNGMKRPVFKKLPVKLQESITLISNGKNADKIIASHLDDVIPDWNNTKGITLKSFAGTIDLDLMPAGVRSAIGKSVSGLGKVLKVLGPATLPLDVIPFVQARDLGIENWGEVGGKTWTQELQKLPRTIEDLFHVAGEGTFEKFGDKPEEDRFFTYEPSTWGDRAKVKALRNTSNEEIIETIKNQVQEPNLAYGQQAFDPLLIGANLEKRIQKALKQKEWADSLPADHELVKEEVKETVDINETDNIFGTSVPTKNLTGVDKYKFNRGI